VLDLTKAKNTGFVIPTWEEALADMTASLEKEEN
ncbi:dTDP-4-dehydrorhamnose reductase, partial [Enterococcus entomosocium]